jgi:hypothetical protein
MTSPTGLSSSGKPLLEYGIRLPIPAGYSMVDSEVSGYSLSHRMLVTERPPVVVTGDQARLAQASRSDPSESLGIRTQPQHTQAP